jgi:hypothetical protein
MSAPPSYNYEAHTKAVEMNKQLTNKVAVLEARLSSSKDVINSSSESQLRYELLHTIRTFLRDFRQNQVRDPTHGLNGEAQEWMNKIDNTIAKMNEEEYEFGQ